MKPCWKNVAIQALYRDYDIQDNNAKIRSTKLREYDSNC